MENIKKGISKKNLTQLNVILEELEKTLNNKCLPLSYPRIIVDSWDFQDILGMELFLVFWTGLAHCLVEILNLKLELMVLVRNMNYKILFLNL